jgi:hypothetical protein
MAIRLSDARRLIISAASLAVPVALGMAAPPASAAAGQLSRSNDSPLPSSKLITGASWTTNRYDPPSNQFGDILATSSLSSDSLYVLINDGGTGTQQPAMWRNSVAKVTGSPGQLQFTNVGDAGEAKTYAEVNSDENQLSGPLGSYYATGFTVVGGVFYATQVNNYDWNANATYNGLAGIAYSTDQGQTWQSPKLPFPGPTGNLNFIQYGSNTAAPDGYVYAIATEREFNASTLIMGRVRPDPADITNPARWQWASAVKTSGGKTTTTWTNSISDAKPVLSWDNHITYPRMSYDSALHRYLLTFTYSYSQSTPGVWKDGSQLVILESPTPDGPFSFVAGQQYFGPSNGYDPALPVNWMSSGGTDMWMIWAANFSGCTSGLDCSGAYGFNYAQLHLTTSKPGASTHTLATLEQHRRRRPPQNNHSRVYATPPRELRPRWATESARPDVAV